MSIVYENGNLFDHIENGDYVAHAISGDYVMGVGLAKQINERVGIVKSLHMLHPYSNPHENIAKALKVDNIFNIVVKEQYNHRARTADILMSLIALEEQCVNEGIDDVYMPQICCGREGVEWGTVKALIQTAFGDSQVTAHIIMSTSKKKEEEQRKDDMLQKAIRHILDTTAVDDLREVLGNIGFTELEIDQLIENY